MRPVYGNTGFRLGKRNPHTERARSTAPAAPRSARMPYVASSWNPSVLSSPSRSWWASPTPPVVSFPYSVCG